MSDLVEFVITDREVSVADFKEAFEFRPERGWHWVQRFAIWILRRLECWQQVETAAYSRRVFHGGDFMERVYNQRKELLRLNYRPEELLIGSEDFKELMGGPEVRQMVQFNADYRHGTEVMGLKVRVIPWMRGILAVPKARA